MLNIKKAYSSTDGLEKYFPALYGEVTEWQKKRYSNLFDAFKTSFNCDRAYFASSSGRVEVCGNHTDHNGGKVISCAISLDTLAAFMPNDKNVINIKSEGYADISIDLLGAENEEKGTSAAIVRGVAVATKNKGYKVGGFDACFTSNVVGGAGISSSASFEVLVAEIFNFIYNDGKITAEEKAVISQFAENEYFGKPCGLLDQTAIAFGGLNLLDFKDKGKIGVKSINNDLKDYTLVLINTGGSHADLTDEYAAVPREMFSVANALGKDRLIESSKEEFLEKLSSISGLSDRAVLRAMHFYNENERVENAYNALNKNDYVNFLTAVKESGISSMCLLQNCFVAGRADELIPKALAITENYLDGGVNRVHGGGFAGSILNIVKNESLDKFLTKSREFYPKEDVIQLRVRSCGAIVL